MRLVRQCQRGSSSCCSPDWYEVMKILLSRLEDEPASQEVLQTVASRDLEHWVLAQPGLVTISFILHPVPQPFLLLCMPFPQVIGSSPMWCTARHCTEEQLAG